jgi:trans-L-3-hydroxyproline dehydratase
MPQNPLKVRFNHNVISCVEMHTSGEPTRVVYAGHPDLQGTLLQQRSQARSQYNHLRRRLNLEPRGHYDMYGAILRPNTELTASGEAHMGVLFTTTEGYSTMCGHATIALGRLLVDSTTDIFPRRNELQVDPESQTALLKLHAPCGLLDVTVPLKDNGQLSDPSRSVSFLSVPSFATGIGIKVPIPISHRWSELSGRDFVTADFSYGGAFFCIIPASELGFSGRLNEIDLARLNTATRRLKAAVNANDELRQLFQHPNEQDLSFLYSIMLVDTELKAATATTEDQETGLCFFADQAVDRSPTGSGVAARVALAHAKDPNFRGPHTYHSLVSLNYTKPGQQSGFVGSVHEVLDTFRDFPVVRVRVEGYGYYTGFTQYVVEEGADPIGNDGFLFQHLAGSSPGL